MGDASGGHGGVPFPTQPILPFPNSQMVLEPTRSFSQPMQVENPLDFLPGIDIPFVRTLHLAELNVCQTPLTKTLEIP